jgi:hypothetical protein
MRWFLGALVIVTAPGVMVPRLSADPINPRFLATSPLVSPAKADVEALVQSDQVSNEADDLVVVQVDDHTIELFIAD